MTKTFYAAKLNKSMGKYLAFTNTKNSPATASQDVLDYAIFFETEDRATSAVEAYLNSPVCKMSKENKKFISIEPFDFEYEFNVFPMTDKYIMLDTTKLKDSKNYVFNSFHIEYGNFSGRGYICAKAYKKLLDSKK